MRRLFGEYGVFVVSAIISLVVLAFAVSGQNNGFLGEKGVGGMKPSQTTASKNNSDNIKSLYSHKDPVLVITPKTLSVGDTYNFYTDFTTTALGYLSDDSTADISDQLEITELAYLSRTDMSKPDATALYIDLDTVDLSSHKITKKGIYEITYKLTDQLGFSVEKTYQFPMD